MTTQAEKQTAAARGDASARIRRPGKFVWFEHVSTDARRAQAFYRAALGWEVHDWQGTGYEMIMAGDPADMDSMIGGYTTPAAPGEKSHWIAYVSVEDVDGSADAAAAGGGRIVEAPHDLPGVGRSARIADPQGAELCLFRNDLGDPADGVITEPPPPGRFFWNELHTTDPAKALAFYAAVVGYTHETMDMGPAGHYDVLSVGGVGRGGVTAQLRSDVGHGAPHWLPYVAADDPDATLARVAPLGGKVLVPAMDVPGVGRFGVLQDPTGAALAVMKALPPKGE